MRAPMGQVLGLVQIYQFIIHNLDYYVGILIIVVIMNNEKVTHFPSVTKH